MGHLTYPEHNEQARPSMLQRVDGAVRLGVAVGADGISRVRDLYQRAPCRLLFPLADAGEPLHAVLLTTSGGLTGGDRISATVDVGAGAGAQLVTQAAEKLYRALPGDAPTRVGVNMHLEHDAWAEWLAQETILFDGARLRRGFHAHLAPGARLLALESIVFGRTAMGESFRHGLLHDEWRVRRDGRLVWADTLRLEGDMAAVRARPWGIGSAIACATLLYAGDDAAALLEPVRNTLTDVPGAGVTLIQDLLITRLWSDDASQLRTRVTALAGLVRSAAAGHAVQLPRVWHC